MLVPAAARPWLPNDSRQRGWPNHGALMIRRGEALAALTAAYASPGRLGLGALAWALGVGGAVLVGQGIAADGEGPLRAVGMGLLLLATVLGGLLVATGSALTHAIAEWSHLATTVSAEGGPVDATSGRDTRRAHDDAVAADRVAGSGALWRMPLLPRTLAALVLGAAAVVVLVQAGLGMAEASTPFAGGEVRGPWLARIVTALVCALTALLLASGLRRVHRARMHRGREQRTTTSPGTSVITPALGSGAIVVGGRQPLAGSPPTWASPASAASPDAAPAVESTRPAPAPPAPAAPAAAAPAGAAAPAAPAVPAEPAVTVRLGDGRRLAPGTTLVGRAPDPRAGERVDATLAVADDRVSKTHLTVRVEAARVVVLDRGSANGTVLHRAGEPQALEAGRQYELAEGDSLLLGATTLTVGEPEVEHRVLRAPTGETAPGGPGEVR